MDQPETPASGTTPTAGIVLQEGRYFAAFWFVNSADKSRDWLAALWKDEGGDWCGAYRFRYYNDDKLVDSSDEKSWYAITIPGETPENIAMRGLNVIADMIAKEYGGAIHKVPLRMSDPVKITERLQREPWFHTVSA